MNITTTHGVKQVAAATFAMVILAGCGSDGGATSSTGDLTGDPITLGSVLTITNPA